MTAWMLNCSWCHMSWFVQGSVLEVVPDTTCPNHGGDESVIWWSLDDDDQVIHGDF